MQPELPTQSYSIPPVLTYFDKLVEFVKDIQSREEGSWESFITTQLLVGQDTITTRLTDFEKTKKNLIFFFFWNFKSELHCLGPVLENKVKLRVIFKQCGVIFHTIPWVFLNPQGVFKTDLVKE